MTREPMDGPAGGRVLIVGEALVDIVEGATGERVEHAGGSPFNVAVGLARLGVDTTLAAQVGDDARGASLRESLAAAGVTADLRSPAPPRTATATATLAPDGSATYEFDLRWDPDSLPAPEQYDAIHVGSLGVALSPGAETVAALVRDAAARGIPVSYDPNVRLAVEPDAERWREVADAVLPSATIVKLSDEDAAVLLPGLDAYTVAVRLAGDSRLAVVTCGPRGLVLATRSAVTQVPAPSTVVADTIGAGDSVAAAILFWLHQRRWPQVALLTEEDLQSLGRLCATAAAITVSRPGADPPRREDLFAI